MCLSSDFLHRRGKFKLVPVLEVVYAGRLDDVAPTVQEARGRKLKLASCTRRLK